MYEQHFGLTRRPFGPAPTLDDLVEHRDYVAARESLERCLRDGAGIAVLTAAAGLGKSLLCQDLQRRLGDSLTVICLCTAQFPNRKAMLQAMLFELGVDYLGLTEEEARLAVLNAIRTAGRDGRALCVIIDEAHLVSNELLDELRTLAEPAAGIPAPLRLLFAGQLEFEERLADRELASLNQRIGVHAVIEPLTRDDSFDYLETRLRRAGAASDLFDAAAKDFIISASDGQPRCVNQLSEHCLFSAFAAGERTITLAMARNALEDLRSLPLHWNDVGLLDGVAEECEELEVADADAVIDAAFTGGAATQEPDWLAGQSAEGVGVFEMGPQREVRGEELLFQSIDPWPAANVIRADAASPAPAPIEFVPDDDLPDVAADGTIDDRYARIDRDWESQHGAVIPQPPDLLKFLSQFTPPEPAHASGHADVPERTPTTEPQDTVGELDDEALSLLETVRELQAQLRRAVADRGLDCATDSGIDFSLSEFDVVYPDDAPAAIDAPPAATPPESARTHEVGAASEWASPTPAPSVGADAGATGGSDDSQQSGLRYSQLFTRLRQKRRAMQQQLAADADWI
ncbi:MAG: AAA family ATPase [Planctomyces sp.]|nr:AAA family ATPase [Planctomyces sp.]